MENFFNNFNLNQDDQQLQLKKKGFEYINDAPYQQQSFGIGEYTQDPNVNINFEQQESYKSIDLFFNDEDDIKNEEIFNGQNIFDNQPIDFQYGNLNNQENLAQIAFEIQNFEQNKEIDSMRMSHVLPSIEHICQEQIPQYVQPNEVYPQYQVIQTPQQEQQLPKNKLQPQPIQIKRIKRKDNHQKDMFKTKNIPKVFGNAFRNYVSSNSAQVQYVCGLNNTSFKDFNNFVKKLNFYSIKGMREAFQQSPEDSKADQLKKIYRILVNKFLREDTWTWFLSNKRISNCRRLCNFRFYILRGLSCPSAFISWED